MKKLDNNTAVKKAAAAITPNNEAFWWNDDARPQGARMEQLEHRRLMSGGLATNSGEESNAAAAAGYEFDLGHRAAPALPPSMLDGAGMAAPNAFAANFHNVRAPRSNFLEGQNPKADAQDSVITGRYNPQVRIWMPDGATVATAAPQMPEHQKREHGAVRLPAKPTPTKNPTPERRGTPHLALVVEDEPGTRLAMAALLRARGWNVTAVGTLAEAEQQLQRGPEILILDLNLPDGHGEKLLEQIRATGMQTKVAITTGESDGERMHHVDDLHPDLVLTKPINLSVLLNMLPANEVSAAA